MARPRRLIVFAIGIGLLAGLDLPATPVRGAQQPIILRSQLVLKADRTLVGICVDEERPVSVEAYEDLVYRMPADPPLKRRPGRRAPQIPVRVIPESVDATIAKASPPFVDLQPPHDFSRSFSITGLKAGSTTIRFRDDRRSALRAEVKVIVGECALKVSATSLWHLNFGFNVDAYGRIPDTLLERTSQGVYEGSSKMINDALGHPIQGCIPTFKPGSSDVSMRATIRQTPTGQVMRVEIRYAQVDVEIAVSCNGIPGNGKGTGFPYTVKVDIPALPETTIMKPHPAHAMDSGRGIFESDTQLVISTVVQ